MQSRFTHLLRDVREANFRFCCDCIEQPNSSTHHFPPSYTRRTLHSLTNRNPRRRRHTSSHPLSAHLIPAANPSRSSSTLPASVASSLSRLRDGSLAFRAWCEGVCGWIGSCCARAGVVRHLCTLRHYRESVDRKVAATALLTSPRVHSGPAASGA